MARKSGNLLLRSLDLLGRLVALVEQLGELAGAKNGRVGVLRGRLQKAQAEMHAHRRRQHLDKRLVDRKADQVLNAVIEYLTALVAESVENEK